MQVVGINASPRRTSNTDLLLKKLLDGAKKGGCEPIHINLGDYEIEYCKACETCYKTGSCVLNDEFCDIYEVMLESDGIVLSSPNYINNVTAGMKALLDRMADTIHCQRFIGKYAVGISTAGGSGAEEVARYLNQSMFTMGASMVGTLGVNISDGEDAFNAAIGRAHELGTKLADAIASKTTYPEQEEDHKAMQSRMRELIAFRKDEWPYEYQYYLDKKWL